MGPNVSCRVLLGLDRSHTPLKSNSLLLGLLLHPEFVEQMREGLCQLLFGSVRLGMEGCRHRCFFKIFPAVTLISLLNLNYFSAKNKVGVV